MSSVNFPPKQFFSVGPPNKNYSNNNYNLFSFDNFLRLFHRFFASTLNIQAIQFFCDIIGIKNRHFWESFSGKDLVHVDHGQVPMLVEGDLEISKAFLSHGAL